ncbi:MAG TPA: hypothetical protein VK386_03690 [Acidimicrobiales bacterium]|nr:hypothetical protein [Acidimicrobiales bacterium]
MVNVPTLFHLLSVDTLQLFSALATSPGHQLVHGQPTIDPNAGFVTQSLGHVAASSWISGHIPWWNSFEGIGAPLAGEMQSAAFFPLTLLLDGTWGFVPFHLVLELVAGWSTYFLARRLGTGRPAATAAGVAFGLCGTFAWLANAPANPVAFLPLMLLGVEQALAASQRRARGGWALLAVAAALSIVAGFPEVAYIDGLLVVLWVVARLGNAGARRLAFAGKVVGGGVLGAALSAPVLVAFLTYLPHADVGGHGGAYGNAALAIQALPQVLLPYVHGPIFGLAGTRSPDIYTLVWGNVGGYITAALAVCALVGLVGGRLRPLRLALGIWVAVALAKTFGLQPLAKLVNLFPGFHEIATYRYSPPSWELAVVVLAALGIDDMARRQVSMAVLALSATLTAALVAWGMVYAWPMLTDAVGIGHRHVFDLASGAWALSTVLCVVVGGALIAWSGHDRVTGARRRRARRAGTSLMVGTICLDALCMFATPLLSAPTPEPVDMAMVRFLQDHLGLYRFATLGPIQPNFGSYFGIAEVNINDLPVPKVYGDYVSGRLDPNVNPLIFTGTTEAEPTGPSPAQELTAHLAAYEAVGVKYVAVLPSGVDAFDVPWPPPSLQSQGVHLAYADGVGRIYELPSPAPFFSTTGACRVAPLGWDAARVDCSRPAVLTRRELSLPGWTAAVSGNDAPVRTVDGIFESTTVPRGTSLVRFTFSPPHAKWSFAAFFIGLAALVAGGAGGLLRRRASLSAARNPSSAGR